MQQCCTNYGFIDLSVTINHHIFLSCPRIKQITIHRFCRLTRIGFLIYMISSRLNGDFEIIIHRLALLNNSKNWSAANLTG
jgi:hypothetical protein